MKHVLIAGGGIIGITTAYYLAEEGYQVTIIDRFDFQTNCSTGNAGLIVPSHIVPLASPGIISQGIRWAFSPKSPFSLNYKLSTDLFKWGLRFWKSSTSENVNKAAPLLRDLNLKSKQLYQSLAQRKEFSINYQERGLLMLCNSEKSLHEELQTADFARNLGLTVQELNPKEIATKEPWTKITTTGGFLYPDDASIAPDLYLKGMMSYLLNRGVIFLSNRTIEDFTINNDNITHVRTASGEIACDEVIITAGVYSQNLFHKLRIKTLMQPGKGYSFAYTAKPFLQTPTILVDARVAITPYQNFTRIAGSMEIGGKLSHLKSKKIQGIVEAMNTYFPELTLMQPGINTIWSGLRPCSVDGLPYIGRTQKIKNIIVATGHSMMGVSLAPITGKLVEELVSNKKPSVDLTLLHPEREKKR